jgi:hypothetical protein
MLMLPTRELSTSGMDLPPRCLALEALPWILFPIGVTERTTVRY